MIRGAGAAAATYAAAVLLADRLQGPLTWVAWRVTLPRGLLLLGAVAAVLVVMPRRARVGRHASTFVALTPQATALALGAVVGLGAGWWRIVGRGATVPSVFGDELLYTGLARSLARGDGLVLRGVPSYGYGVGYPAFAAVFQRAIPDAVGAYDALLTAQALAMASAAVPVYLLARRAAAPAWALVAGALAIATPAMVLSAFVLTEAVFYPASLWLALALVRALERPTVARQAVVLGTLVAVSSVRLQAVVWVVAVLASILLAGLGAPTRDHLRRWLPTLVATSVAAAVWGIAAAVGAVEPLGAYSDLARPPPMDDIVVWTARTVGALALGVVLVALVAFPAGVRALWLGSRQERALATAAVSLVVVVVLQVGYFSASPAALGRIHERNLICAIPLVLVVAVAWCARGMPSSRATISLGAVLTIGGVATVREEDYERVTDIDQLSLVAWRSLDPLGLGVGWGAVLVALAATIAVAMTRRAWALPLVVVVGYAVAVYVPLPQLPRAMRPPLTWIDDAVGRDGRVVVVTAGLPDARCSTRIGEELATWSEMFNVSVVGAAHLLAENRYASLASDRLTIDPQGRLLRAGRPLGARLVVMDSRIALVGDPLATLSGADVGRGTGSSTPALTLWRLHGDARIEDRGKVARLRTCP